MKVAIVNCFDTFLERQTALLHFFQSRGDQVTAFISDFRHGFRSRNIVIGFYFDAGGKNCIDIPLKSFSRQAVVRDSVAQHSAELCPLFVYGYFVAHNGKEKCSTQP